MILASDLHFGANEPEDIEQLRDAVLADRDRLLVLAGDLTQDFRENEFVAAGRFVRGLLDADVAVVCTPGNHDYGRWRGEIRGNQKARRFYEDHILDPVRRQKGVLKSGDADLILRHGADVFVALRSTHAHALKGPRIRSEQLDWVTKALSDYQRSNDDRYHLVTHHSLWPPPPEAKHGPQTQLERLERQLLLPYRFDSVVTGHLHAFECGRKLTPKLKLEVLHVGVPTASTRERGARGYVRWLAPEMPVLVALTTRPAERSNSRSTEMSVKKEIAKGKKAAQEVGTKLAVAAVPLLVEWAKKLGDEALAKAQEAGTTEEQKHCRVCSARISKDKKYVLGSRFRCVKCGHRTHKHCAHSVSGKTCMKCGAK